MNLLFFGKSDLEQQEFDVWHGYVRNVLVFNKLLNHQQLYNLFKYKLKTFYNWLQQGEFEIIKSINSNSCIGCSYVYNTDNLNVYDCSFKSSINSLKDITFVE